MGKAAVNKQITSVVSFIIENDKIKQAIKYVSEKYVVKATRRGYKSSGGKPDKTTLEILLTCGTPNTKEREFIKKCKKAKEPFPVKKIQVKYF